MSLNTAAIHRNCSSRKIRIRVEIRVRICTAVRGLGPGLGSGSALIVLKSRIIMNLRSSHNSG